MHGTKKNINSFCKHSCQPPPPLPQGVGQWDWSAPVNGMFSASLLCYESDTLALKWLENQNCMQKFLKIHVHLYDPWQICYDCSAVEINRSYRTFFMNVRQKILQCWTKYPTENTKNIHFVYEKKQNTSDHKGQQLGFMSTCCFCRHS